jgi:uncharacterized membrane protein
MSDAEGRSTHKTGEHIAAFGRIGENVSVGKGRTESFSDGVLALAITLPALNLYVAPGSGRLLSQAYASGQASRRTQ